MHVRIEQDEYDSRFDVWPPQRLRIEPDFGSDGNDYHVLENALARANGHGPMLEIGVRLGGSLARIMDDSDQRLVIGVDPYGNIDYAEADGYLRRRDYTNVMMQEALANLHLYAYQRGVHFLFLPLEDTEYFRLFGRGLPVYADQKYLANRYSFVHFDGPHDTASVVRQARFFDERSERGTVFVFDDIDAYQHDDVERLLLGWGWARLEKTAYRAAYRRDAA